MIQIRKLRLLKLSCSARIPTPNLSLFHHTSDPQRCYSRDCHCWEIQETGSLLLCWQRCHPMPMNKQMLGWKMEKAMAPHSSTLAGKIPWTEEPSRLQSMGSLRVRHDWVTSLLLFTFMHWRRKWQPTPVFLPGEAQGRGSLVGCHLWGCTESDTTEVT